MRSSTSEEKEQSREGNNCVMLYLNVYDLTPISAKYHGDTYHLIAKNCNHFTNEVCQELTGKPIPGWVLSVIVYSQKAFRYRQLDIFPIILSILMTTDQNLSYLLYQSGVTKRVRIIIC
ncbi:hypothetical protein Tsubulata_023503 [Turnera subulata]|uniref:PPPDE domain-containing protein n=1 Tax=Turnera subulata TaxID=218843 RepID=A0A9Q0GF12_9ROSI|nr:hypothetical protein Tsubulata_023503 [Turnera subulata]